MVGDGAARLGAQAGRAMTVSHETFAQTPCANRPKYHSPYRRRRGEKTRAALIGAVLAFVAEGQWRPKASAIAQRAGVDGAAINQHFGSQRGLNRTVACEHAVEVLQSLGIEPLDDPLTDASQRELVWIVMTGERRARP
jgi:AcrR family transcriptional regulator